MPSAPPSPAGSYWALDAQSLFAKVHSSPAGLSPADAAARLLEFGPNHLRAHERLSRLRALLAQLRNPLLFILLFAAAASLATGEWADATIVVAIVVASVGVAYSREYSAQAAVAALQAQVRTRTNAVRGGQVVKVPVDEIVPGDVVILSAGSLVPGDGVVLEATDCFVSEAVLTGESFPVAKAPGLVPADAAVRDRANSVFLGTNVRSGTAKVLIVHTALSTEFGAIAQRLSTRPPETEFDRGTKRFGYLLTSAMLVLVIVVFAVHVLRGRPPIETLLFSVALAVGLSPELLPAILSVNLARGAQMMARHGVLVRRLNAIENLGSMDLLCTDKTGTLTEGVVEMEGAYGPSGEASTDVRTLAGWNAGLQSGLDNPLDDAITKAVAPDLSSVRKIAEVPFDFIRKRVSVVVSQGDGAKMITKGAYEQVVGACTQSADGTALDAAGLERLRARYEGWTGQGIRVLAVATRAIDVRSAYSRDDERGLVFAGFLTFLDRPKASARQTITDLAGLGVSIKLITGDSKLVAQHLASLVGLRADRVLTGAELHALPGPALWTAAERTDLFVEVDPDQKERIIQALRKTGHVVGFLGDGVNDAPAMHAADTSLSVDSAVDVAREAADFVVLDKDLDVIRRGIEEGRRTFANTMKYILTTTSANVGNMLSMAGASLYLPFLPMLAGQILLNNLLSDIPAIGIADDSVDAEMIRLPERWDIRFIGRFMVEFGVLSSLFDFLTFFVLLSVFRTGPELFRTGWFVESLLTELVIALVVRTRRPFYSSRPGTLLLMLTVGLTVLTFAIPFLPGVGWIGLVPLPVPLLVTLSAITMLYVVGAEILKRWFFRRRSAPSLAHP